MCLQTNTNLHISVTMQNIVVLCVDFLNVNNIVCIVCDSFSSAFSIAFAVYMLYKSTLFFQTFHTFLWDRFSLVLTVIHLRINIWVDPIVFNFDTKYCNVHLFIQEVIWIGFSSTVKMKEENLLIHLIHFQFDFVD